MSYFVLLCLIVQASVNRRKAHECVAVYCNMLWYVAVCCSVLQCVVIFWLEQKCLHLEGHFKEKRSLDSFAEKMR